MAASPSRTVQTAGTETPGSPEAVVRGFLEALAASDLDAALELAAEDLEYTNVPLPALRGRHRLERAFRPLLGRFGFDVHFHAVAADGQVVLTERTDALVLGPVVWQFWVYGRFEVVNGQIRVWRDSFDFADLLVGLLRGCVAVAWPGAARRWPGDRPA